MKYKFSPSDSLLFLFVLNSIPDHIRVGSSKIILWPLSQICLLYTSDAADE